MLGWEFPPAFAGGLGIACYNIVKSLSSRANVHVIVPFANANNDLENVEVTGLNRVEQEFINEKATREFPSVFLSRVDIALSAYPHMPSKKEFLTKTKELRKPILPSLRGLIYRPIFIPVIYIVAIFCNEHNCSQRPYINWQYIRNLISFTRMIGQPSRQRLTLNRNRTNH